MRLFRTRSATTQLAALLALALLTLALLTSSPSAVHAQFLTYAESGKPEDTGLGLLQEDPHDIIYFTQSSGGGWVKAHLLPQRDMPETRRGTIRFSILGIESDEFVAKWSDVETIDFWRNASSARRRRGSHRMTFPARIRSCPS